MAFCRTVAAADAMWASFLANGRLPDKFWELVSLTRKYAELLGLNRALRDAKPIDLASYVAQRYGDDIPAASSDGHSGTTQGPQTRPGSDEAHHR